MIFLISLSLFLIIKERTKKWRIPLVYVIVAVYICRTMFVARAQIISFLLFIFEFWCIEKLLETNKNRYAISLIIIPILIANIHSSVFLTYFVIYLPYIAEYVLYLFKINISEKSNNRLLRKIDKILNKFEIQKREYIKKLFIIGFISLFTGLCSTAGIAPYTDMIKVMLGESTSFIGELEPSTFYNNPAFYYILISIAILVFCTKIKPKITDIFFVIGFALMTITTYRCMYFFVLVGGVSITRIILEYIKEYNIKIENKFLKIILIGLFIILIIVTFFMNLFYNQTEETVPKEYYPVDACDWMIDNIDLENIKIFNNFTYGSYIEFRGIKAFIDSRSGMFCDEFNEGTTILVDWLDTKNNPEKCEEVFDKYEITHILIREEDEQYETVKSSNNWKVLYQDENFTLFENIKYF